MLKKFFYAVRYFYHYSVFLSDYWKFSRAARQRPEHRLVWRDRYPCLSEKAKAAGFDRHYVYHTSWAARILAKTRPDKHVDISSSLYFCSIVSAFIPVEFYDYRLVDMKLDNLSVRQADLLCLPFENESVLSLSCMHVVEHIGLGRYGELLDVFGDIKAIEELKRVLAQGGNLLFVVPVGVPRIMFNAHRIYSYEQVLHYFAGLELVEFALIGEREGGLLPHPSPNMVAKQSYACGCFWFAKPSCSGT